jgi:hypothetical protein
MPDSSDLWYVRLPGGHVVRAASATLREQLASGRLCATGRSASKQRGGLAFDELY